MLTFALIEWVCAWSGEEPERSGPKCHVSGAERWAGVEKRAERELAERWAEITEMGFNADRQNSPLRYRRRRLKKEQLRHRAVSLRQHSFLVVIVEKSLSSLLPTFYPRARRYASAGLCNSDVSVRLSHAGIVPSRAKAGSWNVHHLIAHHSSFWRGMIHRKIRKPNEGGLGFFGDFRPICRHISKTVHFRHKVTMGR